MWFTKAKDGGPDSPVDGFFLFEGKRSFSIVCLRFNKGRRESFHSHAFSALTWFLKGYLVEEQINGQFTLYKRSLKPKVTKKTNVHRVLARKTSWCISIRGPWVDSWFEVDDKKSQMTVMTHGRKVVNKTPYYKD